MRVPDVVRCERLLGMDVPKSLCLTFLFKFPGFCD